MEEIQPITFAQLSGPLIKFEYEQHSEIASKAMKIYPKMDDLMTHILNDEVQVGMCPMKDVPLQLPEGLVITAISKRHPTGFLLVVGSHVQDNSKLLQLKEGVIVGCATALQRAQFKDFRNDVKLKAYDSWFAAFQAYQLYGRYQQNAPDAVLLPAYAESFSKPNAITISLNPKEFIPPSGDGFVAYLCKTENKPLRRQLQAFHHPESVEISNLERRFKGLIPDELKDSVGVYCEQDANGFYQGNAVLMIDAGVRYVQLSSGTPSGFAETLWQKLTS